MVCLGSWRFSDGRCRPSEVFLLPQYSFCMAESPPCVGDAESKGPLSPGLFSFSRGGTVSMPASYCTSMIESHLLVGTVTELNLHSCSFSLHVVSDSGLVPRTGSPPFGPQSSLLISVYAFLVTGLLSSWLQQGEIPRLLLGLKPLTPSHSSEGLALEFWPLWCFISPLIHSPWHDSFSLTIS